MTTQSLGFRAVVTALVLVAGCGREPSPAATHLDATDSTMSLPVRVFSDTGSGIRLAAPAPALEVWVSRVSPSRPDDPAALPPPDPGSGAPEAETPLPPALAVDPGLKPPILRTPASLMLPAGEFRTPRSVELDVRVAEDGTVSDALWAGGDADSILVRTAIESALGMKFYPALRAGLPVAVWCRQRFDFHH